MCRRGPGSTRASTRGSATAAATARRSWPRRGARGRRRGGGGGAAGGGGGGGGGGRGKEPPRDRGAPGGARHDRAVPHPAAAAEGGHRSQGDRDLEEGDGVGVAVVGMEQMIG